MKSRARSEGQSEGDPAVSSVLESRISRNLLLLRRSMLALQNLNDDSFISAILTAVSIPQEGRLVRLE